MNGRTDIAFPKMRPFLELLEKYLFLF